MLPNRSSKKLRVRPSVGVYVWFDHAFVRDNHLSAQVGFGGVDWLRGTVELSDRGEVIIDDRGRTSVPGVFAAGDCTTVPYKQIVIALGAGSTAALSAFDHLIRTVASEPALVGA